MGGFGQVQTSSGLDPNMFDDFNFDDFLDPDPESADYDDAVTQSLDSLDVLEKSALSKAQIRKLKSVKLNPEHVEKELQCTICMGYLKLNCQVKQIPCNHYFHEHCLVPWLKMNATCPNCREIIKVECTVSKRLNPLVEPLPEETREERPVEEETRMERPVEEETRMERPVEEETRMERSLEEET